MTKRRSSNSASTSIAESRYTKVQHVSQNEYIVSVNPKTQNAGYVGSSEALAHQIIERVDQKWNQLVWKLKNNEEEAQRKDDNVSLDIITNEHTTSSQPSSSGRYVEQHSDLNSMSTEQLKEILANLQSEMKRAVAENQKIRAYAREKLCLEEL